MREGPAKKPADDSYTLVRIFPDSYITPTLSEATHSFDNDTIPIGLPPEMRALHVEESPYVPAFVVLSRVFSRGREGLRVRVRGNLYDIIQNSDESYMSIPCGWVGDSHCLGKTTDEVLHNLPLLLDPGLASRVGDFPEYAFGVRRKQRD